MAMDREHGLTAFGREDGGVHDAYASKAVMSMIMWCILHTYMYDVLRTAFIDKAVWLG